MGVLLPCMRGESRMSAWARQRPSSPTGRSPQKMYALPDAEGPALLAVGGDVLLPATNDDKTAVVLRQPGKGAQQQVDSLVALQIAHVHEQAALYAATVTNLRETH